jgi:glutamyl-tRNA synthetase
MSAGRYAPSPTGELHLGNLRTALIAWAYARSTGRDFYLRLEDLDRQRFRDPQSQIDDLEELGIDWDGDIVVQSERLDRYQSAIDALRERDLVFECYCSRRDIREAASAAHAPPGHYPGTCLRLSEGVALRRRAELADRGLQPALRLRPTAANWTITDMGRGRFTGPTDSAVLQRGDGAFAYNLAVVVDDIAMGVDQVVRADDLLASSPLQAYLTHELGGVEPLYGHVPLVLGPTGRRLAKRDGAVTLRELHEAGLNTADVVQILAESLELSKVRSAADFLEHFAKARLTGDPWTFLPPNTRPAAVSQE